MSTTRSTPRSRLIVFAGCLLLAAAALTAGPDTFSVETPTRIMALGASITRGEGSSWGKGYRLWLAQRMVTGRYASDLVGVKNSGPPWLFDRHHEGYDGYRIDQIDALVVTELTAYRPDYVLLLIGGNDVMQDYQLDTAPDRLSLLIDHITATVPNAYVVVASLTPYVDPVFDARARLYNAAIPGVVQAKADAGKRVSFLDMYSLLTLSDLSSDGVHPNDSGYAKISAAWAGSLSALRPLPPPASTRTCPCSIWGPNDAPTTAQVSTTTSAEVGVKFRVEKNGFITAVRFYKGPNNLGPHTATLWRALRESDAPNWNANWTTIKGFQLASGTVTTGSSEGWQEVAFATPVAVQAHELYFASYYAPFGRYAADPGYFRDREIVHSPVRLPSHGSIDGNGFIRGGSQGLPFAPAPNLDTNYWVDVVFVPAQPLPPASVNATASSTSEIQVSWSTADGATGYRVERSLDNTSWSSVATTAPNVTSYQDAGLTPATPYSYRVVTISNGVESVPSATATATTSSLPAPASVTATAVSSTQIDVSWSSVANASGYRVERSLDGSTAWAPVGTTSAGVTSYSNTGLQPATTYYYRVVATTASGDSPPSAVAPATTQALAPTAPGSVTATAVSSTQINVAWAAVADATGYRVERSPDGTTGWAAVGTTSGSVTTYSNTGLQPATTYHYRVVATNTSGDSPPSAVASATTQALAPTAPGSVTATAVSSTQINVAWAAVTNATGYRVERSPDGTTGWAAMGTTSGSVTTYSNTGLQPATTYHYRVVATNTGGDSPPSAVASATTQPLAPTAPGSVTATAVSSTQINVTWSGVTNATGYRVERSPDGTTGWAAVGTTSGSVTSYSNTGLQPATTYHYRVVATNTGGDSPPSAVASATTQPLAPTAPASVTATAVSSTQINVTWSGVANAGGYRVERSPDGNTWAAVGTTSGSVTSYSNTGLQPATTYHYRVVATNTGGDSPPSAVASATTQPLAPTAPASVTATTVSSTQINVAWSAVANATGYRVERSLDGNAWAAVGTTSGSVTSYSNTGLQPATTYYYRVVASNAGGDSPPSGVANATTLPLPPPAPTTLTAAAASSTRINLLWSNVAGETGYRIERSTGGGAWTAIGTTTVDVTSYADTGLAPLTTYSYRVMAANTGGSSAPSPVASATTAGDTTAPTTPTGLKANVPKGKVGLSWTGSTDSGGSGLAGYRIWRSTTGSSGSFTVVGTTTGTSYTDVTVTGNVDYWYQVTAVDGVGNQSQPSNVVSVRAK